MSKTGKNKKVKYRNPTRERKEFDEEFGFDPFGRRRRARYRIYGEDAEVSDPTNSVFYDENKIANRAPEQPKKGVWSKLPPTNQIDDRLEQREGQQVTVRVFEEYGTDDEINQQIAD